jgi:hypothetical protein
MYIECQPMLRCDTSHPSSGHKQESSVIVGGKLSNWLAGTSDYAENRKEIKDTNTIPTGSPVGRKEL